MSVETKYICDKCGRTQDNYDQMWYLSIVVNHYPTQISNYNSGTVSKLWCRKCIDTYNFIGVGVPKENPNTQKEYTFEDKLREIIADEIEKSKL